MTTDIASIAAQLDEATKDAALWERLSTAGDRAKQLARDLDKAKAASEKAAREQADAAKDARLSRITNIRVTTTGNGQGGEGSFLWQPFRISWNAPKWNMYTMASEPGEHSRDYFDQLPPEVYECLVERYPDQIPAAIMALAPGNPGDALGEYLAARRRGYIKAKAAA